MYIHIIIYTDTYIYIYVYTYSERERERDRERGPGAGTASAGRRRRSGCSPRCWRIGPGTRVAAYLLRVLLSIRLFVFQGIL